jgi:regulator of sirC expression with transglutaminase-like and TPR domain
MAVAQRVGIDLRGVSAPKHFLTRYESVGGTWFVEAFSRGRVLSRNECSRWLSQSVGLKRSDMRVALGPRAIVIRMLNNLKVLYARQSNWTAAWMVQHRLTALQPASYQDAATWP